MEIVKKIDDIGRIIIPKSIRSKLRINSGDMFEITLVDDCIVLKQYDELKNVHDILKIICQSFYSKTHKNIFLSNNISIIYSTTRKIINKKISKYMKNVIEDCLDSKKELITGELLDKQFFIMPIKKYGYKIGYIVIYDSFISSSDIEIIKLYNLLLLNYLEQNS